MTDSEKLMEALIALDIVREQYALEFYDRVLKKYRRLSRRIERIIKPEYGNRLTIAKKNELRQEIYEELQDFESTFSEEVRQELIDASYVFYDQDGEAVRDIRDVEIAERNNLTRGFFTNVHPTEKGNVISLNAMYSAFILNYRNDIERILNRLGSIKEEPELVEGYYKNVTSKNQNYLNAVSLTSIALIASLVRQAFIKANSKLFDGYQWISILDAKTSDYCQFRHSKIWYFNDPENSTLPAEEYPPGHFRCRSSIAYIFKGEQAPAEVDFVTWFERQSSSMKEEILGTRRYEMYTKGNLDIRDLNNVRGERRTLEQLKNLRRNR